MRKLVIRDKNSSEILLFTNIYPPPIYSNSNISKLISYREIFESIFSQVHPRNPSNLSRTISTAKHNDTSKRGSNHALKGNCFRARP